MARGNSAEGRATSTRTAGGPRHCTWRERAAIAAVGERGELGYVSALTSRLHLGYIFRGHASAIAHGDAKGKGVFFHGMPTTRATLASGVSLAHTESWATICGGVREVAPLISCLQVASRKARVTISEPGVSQAESYTCCNKSQGTRWRR